MRGEHLLLFVGFFFATFFIAFLREVTNGAGSAFLEVGIVTCAVLFDTVVSESITTAQAGFLC